MNMQISQGKCRMKGFPCTSRMFNTCHLRKKINALEPELHICYGV